MYKCFYAREGTVGGERASELVIRALLRALPSTWYSVSLRKRTQVGIHFEIR